MMTRDFQFNMTRCLSRNWRFIWGVLAIALLLRAPVAHAQTFESGSDGSDGALNLTTPGTIDFDPGALGLDADGDHIFHFTTINIAADVTLRLSARQINGPVFWLASGDVQIDGIIDLNGEDGQSRQDIQENNRLSAVPGSGGFGGGLGSTVNGAATPGLGPGGGGVIQFRQGGWAGHVVRGLTPFNGAGGGIPMAMTFWSHLWEGQEEEEDSLPVTQALGVVPEAALSSLPVQPRSASTEPSRPIMVSVVLSIVVFRAEAAVAAPSICWPPRSTSPEPSPLEELGQTGAASASRPLNARSREPSLQFPSLRHRSPSFSPLRRRRPYVSSAWTACPWRPIQPGASPCPT